MALTFRGGIHPEDNKKETKSKAIETPTPPVKVVIPLSMHIGAPCEPLVKVGDYVKLGQKIGESGAAVSAPVHSSVSGTVLEIAPYVHPNGTRVMSVSIENDYADTPYDGCKKRSREQIAALKPGQITELIREAGIVGLGGAAFPTHVKIKSSVGKVDTLIINCAECEPYITSGYRGMLENTESIVRGTALIMRAVGLKDAIIAVESNKLDAAGVFEGVISRVGAPITVKVVRTKYPQGGEKQLIYALTKREVPPGQLPAAVKCAVFSSETCAAVYTAVSEGMPITTRVVTVAGSAVANPKNLCVRVGTAFENLFSAAGGFLEEPYKIIMGGPMMGSAVYSTDSPVIKSTNALLAFSKNEEKFEEEPTCIRCSRCVSACPMNLMPVYIAMYYNKSRFDKLAELNVSDCIECGSCSYVCPGRLHLTHTCRAAKARLIELDRKGAVK
ncbi:MAG: electron transport complex subunit RsxC [Oscillospiraceae bacterium]|jgi:electron transport complex protein RnfC|nr:electron transport complex subunit RsxC [Oscillospiraceae bacterium]